MDEYYKILLSEYIKPPTNMIIENTEGLSGYLLKLINKHNNMVKSYIKLCKENSKENLITYIKSKISVNAGYDEKLLVESLIKYVLHNNYIYELSN